MRPAPHRPARSPCKSTTRRFTGGNRNDVTQLIPLLERVPPVRGCVGRRKFRGQEINPFDVHPLVVRQGQADKRTREATSAAGLRTRSDGQEPGQPVPRGPRARSPPRPSASDLLAFSDRRGYSLPSHAHRVAECGKCDALGNSRCNNSSRPRRPASLQEDAGWLLGCVVGRLPSALSRLRSSRNLSRPLRRLNPVTGAGLRATTGLHKGSILRCQGWLHQFGEAVVARPALQARYGT